VFGIDVRDRVMDRITEYIYLSSALGWGYFKLGPILPKLHYRAIFDAYPILLLVVLIYPSYPTILRSCP